MTKSNKRWYITLITRIIGCLLINNVLIPDEVYQSVEVSYRMNYNIGYMTWEWHERIRGYLLPLIFSYIFKLCDFINLSQYNLIACRLFMGFLLFANDVITAKLAKRWFGPKVEIWALVASLFSFCHWILGFRWLGNTFEMALINLSLYFWPLAPKLTHKDINYRSLALSLIIGGFVCMLRPTSAIIYAFIGVDLIFRCQRLKDQMLLLILSSVLVLIMISIMIFIDTQYYHQFTFVPYEFIQFNVLKGISSYYGVHNALWYIYSGLPTILTSLLPFTVFGFYLHRSKYITKFCLKLSILYIGVFSLLPHKEFRFIYPLLPTLIIMGATGLNHIVEQNPKRLKSLLLFLIITSLLPGLYINWYHLGATLPVMDYLKVGVIEKQVTSIGFLIPCHTVPFYSHLQRDTPMWFLTCSPNLTHDPNYLDSEDQFYRDPINFIETNFKEQAQLSVDTTRMDPGQEFEYFWPSHLIVFSSLLDTRVPDPSQGSMVLFRSILNTKGYQIEKIFWNSHFSTPRRRGKLVILKRNENSND